MIAKLSIKLKLNHTATPEFMKVRSSQPALDTFMQADQRVAYLGHFGRL